MVRAGLVACITGVTLGFGGALFWETAAADTLSAPECMEVGKSAPYRGYGYAHLVTLRSSCESDHRCAVSTDVTPNPIHIEVAAGASETITTRIGSPASTFEAIVSCEEN